MALPGLVTQCGELFTWILSGQVTSLGCLGLGVRRQTQHELIVLGDPLVGLLLRKESAIHWGTCHEGRDSSSTATNCGCLWAVLNSCGCACYVVWIMWYGDTDQVILQSQDRYHPLTGYGYVSRMCRPPLLLDSELTC
jgi:hypothetical protein